MLDRERVGKNLAHVLSKQSMLAKTYLLAYNIVQVIGWSYLGLQISRHFWNGRRVETLWSQVETTVVVFQTLAVLEILHSLLRLVRSSVAVTVMQVASRLFLVWYVCLVSVDSRRSYGVPLMLTAWTSVEVIRYSYYAFGIVGMEPKLIQWLRYTAFIVLYPMGVSGEMICASNALKYYAEERPFSLDMPNILNATFDSYYLLVFTMLTYVPAVDELVKTFYDGYEEDEDQRRLCVEHVKDAFVRGRRAYTTLALTKERLENLTDKLRVDSAVRKADALVAAASDVLATDSPLKEENRMSWKLLSVVLQLASRPCECIDEQDEIVQQLLSSSGSTPATDLASFLPAVDAVESPYRFEFDEASTDDRLSSGSEFEFSESEEEEARVHREDSALREFGDCVVEDLSLERYWRSEQKIICDEWWILREAQSLALSLHNQQKAFPVHNGVIRLSVSVAVQDVLWSLRDSDYASTRSYCFYRNDSSNFAVRKYVTVNEMSPEAFASFMSGQILPTLQSVSYLRNGVDWPRFQQLMESSFVPWQICLCQKLMISGLTPMVNALDIWFSTGNIPEDFGKEFPALLAKAKGSDRGWEMLPGFLVELAMDVAAIADFEAQLPCDGKLRKPWTELEKAREVDADVHAFRRLIQETLCKPLKALAVESKQRLRHHLHTELGIVAIVQSLPEVLLLQAETTCGCYSSAHDGSDVYFEPPEEWPSLAKVQVESWLSTLYTVGKRMRILREVTLRLSHLRFRLIKSVGKAERVLLVHLKIVCFGFVSRLAAFLWHGVAGDSVSRMSSVIQEDAICAGERLIDRLNGLDLWSEKRFGKEVDLLLKISLAVVEAWDILLPRKSVLQDWLKKAQAGVIRGLVVVRNFQGRAEKLDAGAHFQSAFGDLHEWSVWKV
ncbi:unnamed protein product [Notodromas monacha]|uniref:Very-long-chain (3R)-3-hydroxyacyl-CoA dehydratase n=1 Tax=Notodromas monacha TaxID=399045 RepID=A0A7R9BFM8_9CRUS|nr:unnamed protein product [Notodromas monacha]CAG0914548.1 unnamed protein product [Notodromas monacha]